MKKQFCWFVCCLISTDCIGADRPVLNLFTWSTDLAPIVSLDEHTQQPWGIIIDVLASLPADQQVDLNVIVHNRNRGEEALYSGEVDAAPLARRWLQYPDKLIYSLPVYVHREFLYATSKVADKPFNVLLQGKTVCTRRGYVYPVVEALFQQGQAIRVDSHIEQTQFEMLLKGRCDYVLTNEFVGEWLIERNGWHHSVFRSISVIDEVGFTLAFNPKWQTFVENLNKHIQQLEQSKELLKIVNKQRKRM